MVEQQATVSVNQYHLPVRVGSSIMILVLLSILAWYQGLVITQNLLPFYKASISLISPHYEPKQLNVTKPKKEHQIALQAVTKSVRHFETQDITKGLSISSSTLVGHVLQPLIVLFCLIPLLPISSTKRFLAVFLLALPGSALVLFLDVPFVLVGAMEDLILYHLSPESLSTSPWVAWMHFMNGGGRLAIPIMVLAVLFWLTKPKPIWHF